ncbi:MAG TPA: hypothetical protein PKO07_14170 [Pseudomonadota bacterium]|jgi:hypothetical protein|nr:hypothetical protein [Pseudomonadota bacterium]HNN52170.1 hypothetical protein [Pseudomonadota bacterium]
MDTNKKRFVTLVFAGLMTLSGCGVDDPGRTPGGGSGGGTGGGTTTGCLGGCARGFRCQVSSCVLDATGFWTVRITSGTVASRNASGSHWDTDLSDPDPKVCLTINGNRSCTRTIADTLSPVWNTDFSAASATALQAGITVEYLDTDLAFDDPICSGNLAVSASDFASGTWGFTCQSGLGQVRAQLLAQ